MGETVGSALAKARKRLAAAGVEGAALDARLLLQHAAHLTHEEIALAPERVLPEAQIKDFDELYRRRMLREPVSKILGCKEFHGHEFIVSRGVLDPRPDSEALISLALRLVSSKRDIHILDLGSGSGALIVSLLKAWPEARGVAVDVSAEARRITLDNARRHGVEGRIGVIDGPWFAHVDGVFDLIVSNPPYIATDEITALQPEVRDHEPHLALDGGVDGLTCYRAIATSCLPHLGAAGLIAVEIGAKQADAVDNLFVRAGFVKLDQEFDLGNRVRALAFGRN